jgi:hypothetical protein
VIPTVDLRLLWADLHRPATWIVAAIVLVVCLIGWRVGSKTYWRVLVASAFGVIGIGCFVSGISSPETPVGLWAGQAALFIFGAGYLLARARRLHKLERMLGRTRGSSPDLWE